MIGAGLARTKQYANQIDGQVRTLKADTGRLKTSKTPQDTNKNIADALGTIGNLFYLQRKMGIGYARASALLDQLESIGIIDVGDPGKSRAVVFRRNGFKDAPDNVLKG